MKLRNLSAGEVERVLGWAAEEGWNPGLDDTDPFVHADPDGYFGAEIDGQVAAAISVVNHTDDFAFLGLYICRPEHRGRGIGYALWQHALAHAGDRVVGLDGVPDQQANYAKSGFDLIGQTSRYVGVIPPRRDTGLRPVAQADIGALTRLESAANGYAKPRFLAHWLTDTDTRRTVVLDGEDGIDGFATIRKCRSGSKIGPLVARTAEQATTLLHGAAVHAGGLPVMVDWPSDMQDMAGYCDDLGMTVPFVTARMYRGPAPQPGSMIRAIATLELG